MAALIAARTQRNTGFESTESLKPLSAKNEILNTHLLEGIRLSGMEQILSVCAKLCLAMPWNEFVIDNCNKVIDALINSDSLHCLQHLPFPAAIIIEHETVRPGNTGFGISMRGKL